MAILPNFNSWRDTSSGCVCKCISLQALGNACLLCVLAILIIHLVLGAVAAPWSATDSFCSMFVSHLLSSGEPHGCPRWKMYLQQWLFSKDIWVFRLQPARTNYLWAVGQPFAVGYNILVKISFLGASGSTFSLLLPPPHSSSSAVCWWTTAYAKEIEKGIYFD